MRCIKHWWICLANLHQNTTWIHVVVRWLHLRHLYQSNACHITSTYSINFTCHTAALLDITVQIYAQ